MDTPPPAKTRMEEPAATAAAECVAAPGRTPVPRWALHRRLYDWMLSFADSRFGLPALFLFSVCESVFFPVPSLALQIPMTLARREHAWRHAAVNLAGSLAGGAAGYAAGIWCLDLLKGWFPAIEAKQAQFQPYADHAGLLVAGALAIHPFKVFTILAGALEVNFAVFLLACLVGRGLLFFGVALLLRRFGAPVKGFIDRWFNWICLALGLLLAALVLLPKLL